MYWIIAIMSLLLLATLGAGSYLQLYPQRRLSRGWRKAILVNLTGFLMAEAALLLLTADSALAQAKGGGGGEEGSITLGMGLAVLGAGLPTGLATIGAGIAIGPVGAAAMATIAERPEAFGRTLVYLGLAEGIAIYGLVISIMLLARI